MNRLTPIRIFVDSDVIISSLLSSSGAAYMLLNETKDTRLYLSNFSIAELEPVTARLHIKPDKLSLLIAGRLTRLEIAQPYEAIQKQFADYVLDSHDAHIVAGAKQARASFLVSYNTRHFQADKLKQDFKLILMTPGTFLQYRRSADSASGSGE